MTFYLQCINIVEGVKVRRFQPLGFAYAVSFVPARDIDGSRFLNLKCNGLKNSEVVTFSCAVNGRVQVDDVWADAPRISLGEDLYVSKIDFQPYTTNNFNSGNDKAWKVGISRVNKFKGMKRGATLNRTLDIFIVIHNHPNRLKIDDILYHDGGKPANLDDSAEGLVKQLRGIKPERIDPELNAYDADKIFDYDTGADQPRKKPVVDELGPDDGSKTFKIRKEIQDARMGGHNDMAGIGDMLKKGAKSLKNKAKKGYKQAKKAGKAVTEAGKAVAKDAGGIVNSLVDAAAMADNKNIGNTNKRLRKTSISKKNKRRKIRKSADYDDY